MLHEGTDLYFKNRQNVIEASSQTSGMEEISPVMMPEVWSPEFVYTERTVSAPHGQRIILNSLERPRRVS